MRFVGRDEELKKIKNYIKENTRSLIGIVGRRGVGKTRLLFEINEIVKREQDLITINLRGTKFDNKKAQINNNLLNLKKIFPNENIPTNLESGQWREFFQILEEQIFKQNKKVVLLIDEFAWLNTKNSGFVEQFAYFYDNLMNIVENKKFA